MNEKDTMRLFNIALAREIIRMDRDELLSFVASREEQLCAMNGRRSVFVYSGNRPRMRTTEKVFNEFFKDDPAEVRQMLIEDLCYPNEPFEISYFARCGYLDHPSSCYIEDGNANAAISSLDLLPWPEDSEACSWTRRFDVLDRDHIALMSEALRTNRDKVATEEYTKQLLTLRSLEKTLDLEPGLRVAYIYDH